MDPEYYDDELPPPKRWPIVVAAVLAIAVALAFGLNSLLNVAPDVLRPAGDEDSYAFLQTTATGDPVRYNPCDPIAYVVNKRGAPAGAIADLEAALVEFEEAMDVDFAFEGFTDERAVPDRRAHQPERYGPGRWAPILFAWVPPEQLLKPSEQAVGAAGSATVTNGAGVPVYVTGTVTFNSEAKLLSGFELGASWGDVALHELGHIVGLDHVDDTTQVMNPDVTGGEARLGAGDLRGLELLGSESGCVQVPAP